MAVLNLNEAFRRPDKSTNGHSISVPVPAFIRLPFRLASVISPRLAGEMARLIFFHPMRTRPNEAQAAVLAKSEPITLDLDGLKVAGYSWGEGPLVLLVHGWSGHAGQMTEFVAPLTSGGFRAVALDLPGHGASGGRLSSLVHFARAIRVAAEHLGPVHGIVSHSFGGGGMIQAFLSGLQANRAVLLAPPAQFHDYWGMFRSRMGMSHAVWRTLVERSEHWLGISFPEVHPEIGAPAMTVPALILHGTADRVCPVTEGRRLARLWPGARLREFDAGHVSILRDARAVAATVEFIKGS
jgi:pimeloyl-ACP methyl ester carboxylesterase